MDLRLIFIIVGIGSGLITAVIFYIWQNKNKGWI